MHRHFRRTPRIWNFIFVDQYGCVRLLTEICLTLTTLYRSEIPLRLIKIKKEKYENAVQIDQINQIGSADELIRQLAN